MTFFSELRSAFRLAKRDFSGKAGRAVLVFIVCLGVGVAVITGSGLTTKALKSALAADAKAILGGDLDIRSPYEPLPPNKLKTLSRFGRFAHIVRVRAMAQAVSPRDPNAPGHRRRQLTELKAVDGAYPLYGEFLLESGLPLSDALTVRDGLPGAVAERALFQRLNLELGDRIKIGEAEFRLTGVIEREPDKPAGFFGLGPRLLIGLADLDRTGVVKPGGLVTHAYPIRLNPGLGDAAVLKNEIETLLDTPGLRVRQYAESAPNIKKFLDNLTQYLVLVGLAALLVGGVGVGSAARTWLEGKAQSIAVMKCLGAEQRLLFTIHLVQALFMTGLGVLFGTLFGIAATYAALLVLADALNSPGLAATAHLLDPGPPLLAGTFGLLVSLVFCLARLSVAARTSPARLFRGYADPVGERPSIPILLVVIGLIGLLFPLVQAVTGKTKHTLAFFGATALCALVYLAAARLVAALARRFPKPRRPALKLALAGLHRPGADVGRILLSMGPALTILTAVFTVDSNLRGLIRDRLPDQAPSYFFLEVEPERLNDFEALVRATPGVVEFASEPSLRGRITKINGVPVEQVKVAEEVEWAVRGDRGLSFAATPPPGSKLTAGAWWTPDYSGPPLIALESGIAKGFGVRVGDTLTTAVLGREITATIAVLRDIDWSGLALNHAILFAPGVLERAPYSLIATARAESLPAEAALFERISRGFPEVRIVYVRDVLETVSGVLRNIGLAIGAAGLTALVSGLFVLVETFRTGLARRFHEAVILKTVGATKRDVLWCLGAEFLALGLCAACIAAPLGMLLAWGFMEFMLKTPFTPTLGPPLLVGALGVGAVLLIGGLGLGRVLGKKVWPVLRNE